MKQRQLFREIGRGRPRYLRPNWTRHASRRPSPDIGRHRLRARQRHHSTRTSRRPAGVKPPPAPRISDCASDARARKPVVRVTCAAEAGLICPGSKAATFHHDRRGRSRSLFSGPQNPKASSWRSCGQSAHSLRERWATHAHRAAITVPGDEATDVTMTGALPAGPPASR